MPNENEAFEQVQRFARSRVALDARVIGISHDHEHDRWVADIVSSKQGSCRILARYRDGKWEVWKYLGALR